MTSAKPKPPLIPGETRAYPVLFASPSAVMREGVRNLGMAEIASPWSGAVAEQA